MKSTAALLALAATASASSLPKRDDNKVPDVWDSMETLCKGWDLETPEGVETLWQETAAGDELDIFILSQWQHEFNWIKNLESAVMDGTIGKTGADKCILIDRECDPMGNMQCDVQYDRFGAKEFSGKAILGKNSYWIFQAAKGAHGKLKELKSQILEKSFVTSLKIDQMISDFEGNEDDTGGLLKWLGAAASIGSYLSGASSNVAFGMTFGILSQIFTVMDGVDKEAIDRGTISYGLGKLTEAASEKLGRILFIAMGGSENMEDYNILPDPKPDPWYKSRVTKFLNNGWFLLNDDTEVVRTALKSVSDNIQPKVANNVMKAAGFRLVADRRKTSREDCGYATGRQWMALREGEEYCFYIMKHHPMPNRAADWSEASEENYGKMAEYGLGNREAYYRAILDCALSENKDVDLGNMVWGKAPTCYFDLSAVFIDKDDTTVCGGPFDAGECNYLSAVEIK